MSNSSEPMNENEWRRQVMADDAQRSDDAAENIAIDQYRYIGHVVRQASLPEIPAGFAAQLEHCVQDFVEQAKFESALVRAVIGLGIAGSTWSLFAARESIAAVIATQWTELPSGLLLAGIGLAAVALIDRVLIAGRE